MAKTSQASIITAQAETITALTAQVEDLQAQLHAAKKAAGNRRVLPARAPHQLPAHMAAAKAMAMATGRVCPAL